MDNFEKRYLTYIFLILLAMVLVAGLVSAFESYLVAKSPDPLSTKCAMSSPSNIHPACQVIISRKSLHD